MSTRGLFSQVRSWPGRLVVATLVGTCALIAVFRATLPHTASLRLQEDLVAVDASAPTFPRMLELYTRTRFEHGNHVEILLNGEGTYPRLWDDLRNAHATITVQSYYSKPSAMADTLSDILGAKARSGVRVLLLLDAFGSQAMPRAWLDALRGHGVSVALLRPLRWHSLHGAADRSHVRAVVIDGQIGYTGGFGFADYWSGDGRKEGQWRETNVRVEGPAAMQLQAAFISGWLEATGELITGRAFLGPSTPVSDFARVRAGLLFTTPSTGSTDAERFLALAILSARKKLSITNSYFVPNADFRGLLVRAARSGIDVRVLTAGPSSDVRTTRYASRHHYEELLRAGIRIYEYDASMMHAKALSVDGMWGAIGSMNFDNRSLAFNDESTLVVYDSSFAAQLDTVFENDLRHASEVTLVAFLGRSRWQRLLESSANLLAALL